MKAKEYHQKFIDLALRNVKRLVGTKDKTVQAEIAVLMSEFINDVVSGAVTKTEYEEFSNTPNVIRYYMPLLDDNNEDFIEILLDNSLASSITCPVKVLILNSNFEQFVIEHVSYSYLERYKKQVFETCDIDVDAYHYEVLSCPTDVYKLYLRNLVAHTDRCLKDVEFVGKFILKLCNHFESICPMESAKLRGLVLYLEEKDAEFLTQEEIESMLGTVTGGEIV